MEVVEKIYQQISAQSPLLSLTESYLFSGGFYVKFKGICNGKFSLRFAVIKLNSCTFFV